MNKKFILIISLLCILICFNVRILIARNHSKYDNIYINNLMNIEDNLVNLNPLVNITKQLGFHYSYFNDKPNKQNDSILGNTDSPELFAGYFIKKKRISKIFFFNQATFDIIKGQNLGIFSYIFQNNKEASDEPFFYALNSINDPTIDINTIYNKDQKILGYWMEETFTPHTLEIDFIHRSGFTLPYPVIEVLFGIRKQDNIPYSKKEKILSQGEAFSIVINANNINRFFF